MMDKKPIRTPDRKRLLGIAIAMFALFSLLIAQFFRIQIIEGNKWSKVASRQHFFIVKEAFRRGNFFSNTSLRRSHPEKPQLLTTDIEKFHLYIDPESIPEENRNEIAKHLMGTLELSVEEQKQLRAQFDHKSRSRKLAMWLDLDQREAVMDWWQPYAKKHHIVRNALFFVTDYQRSYPFGKLLGQVLHTIQNNKDEQTKQAVPTGGLELYFQHYLKGKQGKRLLMRSPRNSFDIGEVIEKPQNGADIYLTISHSLQAIVEDELAKGVRNCKAKAGWAVMMDPRTGEILALAQCPAFHPPEYQHYFNDKTLIEHTKVKAITDANELGSIMKPITLAIGLMANNEMAKKGKPPLITVEEKMATSDGHFPGRGKKPIEDTHLHRFLNFNMALQKSSNIYMARVVQRIIQQLGEPWYRDVLATKFKFGERTGIELPAESPGVLPRIGKKHPNGTEEWSTATPFSIAFGHNIQITSMQIVRIYSLFANGGYLVQPTLVRKVVRTDDSGNEEILLDHTGPERVQAFPKVLDDETVKTVVTAMKYVTKLGGTARKADVPGYTEVGKTSTAKKIVNGSYSETLYCSSFVGFAPVVDPSFVLLVTMDEPLYGYIEGIGKNHNGSNCSAPVFCAISKRALEYLGVPPDDPYGYPPGDPRYKADKADWVQESKQLQATYEAWNH
jgi:cell division protein FtsI (penicillin-binding protein 3)